MIALFGERGRVVLLNMACKKHLCLHNTADKRPNIPLRVEEKRSSSDKTAKIEHTMYTVAVKRGKYCTTAAAAACIDLCIKWNTL